MDVRRFGQSYRSPSYTLARTVENYETYYDIRYPNHERSAGRPLRRSSAYAWHVGARRRRSARSPAGSGSTGTTPNAPTATRRGARAAGPGALVAGDRWPSTARPARRAALFDESSFAKIEISGPGAARLPRVGVRQRGRARGRVGHLHADAQRARRHRVRLHRDAARRASASSIVTGTAFGNHDARVAAHARRARRRPTCAIADVTGALVVLRALGPARRATSSRRSRRTTSATTRSRTCRCARPPSATCRCAWCA